MERLEIVDKRSHTYIYVRVHLVRKSIRTFERVTASTQGAPGLRIFLRVALPARKRRKALDPTKRIRRRIDNRISCRGDHGDYRISIVIVKRNRFVVQSTPVSKFLARRGFEPRATREGSAAFEPVPRWRRGGGSAD